MTYEGTDDNQSWDGLNQLEMPEGSSSLLLRFIARLKVSVSQGELGSSLVHVHDALAHCLATLALTCESVLDAENLWSLPKSEEGAPLKNIIDVLGLLDESVPILKKEARVSSLRPLFFSFFRPSKKKKNVVVPRLHTRWLASSRKILWAPRGFLFSHIRQVLKTRNFEQGCVASLYAWRLLHSLCDGLKVLHQAIATKVRLTEAEGEFLGIYFRLESELREKLTTRAHSSELLLTPAQENSEGVLELGKVRDFFDTKITDPEHWIMGRLDSWKWSSDLRLYEHQLTPASLLGPTGQSASGIMLPRGLIESKATHSLTPSSPETGPKIPIVSKELQLDSGFGDLSGLDDLDDIESLGDLEDMGESSASSVDSEGSSDVQEEGGLDDFADNWSDNSDDDLSDLFDDDEEETAGPRRLSIEDLASVKVIGFDDDKKSSEVQKVLDDTDNGSVETSLDESELEDSSDDLDDVFDDAIAEDDSSVEASLDESELEDSSDDLDDVFDDAVEEDDSSVEASLDEPELEEPSDELGENLFDSLTSEGEEEDLDGELDELDELDSVEEPQESVELQVDELFQEPDSLLSSEFDPSDTDVSSVADSSDTTNEEESKEEPFDEELDKLLEETAVIANVSDKIRSQEVEVQAVDPQSEAEDLFDAAEVEFVLDPFERVQVNPEDIGVPRLGEDGTVSFEDGEWTASFKDGESTTDSSQEVKAGSHFLLAPETIEPPETMEENQFPATSPLVEGSKENKASELPKEDLPKKEPSRVSSDKIVEDSVIPGWNRKILTSKELELLSQECASVLETTVFSVAFSESVYSFVGKAVGDAPFARPRISLKVEQVTDLDQVLSSFDRSNIRLVEDDSARFAELLEAPLFLDFRSGPILTTPVEWLSEEELGELLQPYAHYNSSRIYDESKPEFIVRWAKEFFQGKESGGMLFQGGALDGGSELLRSLYDSQSAIWGESLRSAYINFKDKNFIEDENELVFELNRLLNDQPGWAQVNSNVASLDPNYLRKLKMDSNDTTTASFLEDFVSTVNHKNEGPVVLFIDEVSPQLLDCFHCSLPEGIYFVLNVHFDERVAPISLGATQLIAQGWGHWSYAVEKSRYRDYLIQLLTVFGGQDCAGVALQEQFLTKSQERSLPLQLLGYGYTKGLFTVDSIPELPDLVEQYFLALREQLSLEEMHQICGVLLIVGFHRRGCSLETLRQLGISQEYLILALDYLGPWLQYIEESQMIYSSFPVFDERLRSLYPGLAQRVSRIIVASFIKHSLEEQKVSSDKIIRRSNALGAIAKLPLLTKDKALAFWMTNVQEFQQLLRQCLSLLQREGYWAEYSVLGKFAVQLAEYGLLDKESLMGLQLGLSRSYYEIGLPVQGRFSANRSRSLVKDHETASHNLVKLKAIALLRIGQNLLLNGDLETAEPNLNEAVILLESIGSPSNEEKLVLAEAYEQQVYLHRKKEEQELALVAVKKGEKCAKDVPQNIETRELLGRLLALEALILFGKSKYKPAIEVLNESIKTSEILLEDRDSLQYRNDLAGLINNRGSIYQSLSQFDLSLSDYSESITMRQKLVDQGETEVHSNLAVAHYNRASLLMALGRLEQSLKDFDKAVELQREILDVERFRSLRDYVSLLGYRAQVYRLLKLPKEEQADLAEAHKLLLKAQGPPALKESFLGNLEEYCRTLLDYGEKSLAISVIDASLEWIDTWDEHLSDSLASARSNHLVRISEMLVDHGEADRAILVYQRVVERFTEMDATSLTVTDLESSCAAYAEMAQLTFASGAWSSAQDQFKVGEKVCKKYLLEHPEQAARIASDYLKVLEGLAHLEFLSDMRPYGLHYCETMLELSADYELPTSMQNDLVLCGLIGCAQAYTLNGDFAQGLEVLEEAVKVHQRCANTMDEHTWQLLTGKMLFLRSWCMTGLGETTAGNSLFSKAEELFVNWTRNDTVHYNDALFFMGLLKLLMFQQLGLADPISSWMQRIESWGQSYGNVGKVGLIARYLFKSYEVCVDIALTFEVNLDIDIFLEKMATIQQWQLSNLSGSDKALLVLSLGLLKARRLEAKNDLEGALQEFKALEPYLDCSESYKIRVSFESAKVLYALARYRECLNSLEKSFTGMQAQDLTETGDFARTLVLMGKCLSALNEEGARDYFAQALIVFQESFVDGTPEEYLPDRLEAFVMVYEGQVLSERQEWYDFRDFYVGLCQVSKKRPEYINWLLNSLATVDNSVGTLPQDVGRDVLSAMNQAVYHYLALATEEQTVLLTQALWSLASKLADPSWKIVASDVWIMSVLTTQAEVKYYGETHVSRLVYSLTELGKVVAGFNMSERPSEYMMSVGSAFDALMVSLDRMPVVEPQLTQSVLYLVDLWRRLPASVPAYANVSRVKLTRLHHMATSS